jgi:alpha-glucosidase
MTWWREAVVYQIYPRSFCDTNGDGIGDLNGVRSKLAYLKDLGVDALWLSPIFPSPMRDFGYDVSDYTGIDPVFGTLSDFDDLVREAHERGIRVLLDWVANHTSSDHPWFVDSRSSTTSAHRDWYVWRDARPDGSLPNNWVRAWSEEAAWTWDETTGQYYLHCFLPSQPDLNWANVGVRSAMHETLRFWLDRGVDGFRMDVIHLLGKEIERDDPEELRVLSHTPLNDVAVTHEYLREIRAVLDVYEGDRVAVGEVYLLDPERVATYYGDNDELHLSFNFASLFTPWRANAWRDIIEKTESALGAVNAWPTWVLSNHDNARVATRLGGDLQRVRAALVLLLTLRGTPFLYAGDELGMEDAQIAPERVVDPGGRDGCRSPIPWTASADHGWPVEPWLPFASRGDVMSVESQDSDESSMLNFTRRLLALRRGHVALVSGELVDLRVEGDVLSFDRVSDDSRLRVMVNFKDAPAMSAQKSGRVLLTSASGSADGQLNANEVVVLELSN